MTPSLKASMRSGLIARVCRAPARHQAGSARPGPPAAARSTGLNSRHERSERQPQPMQEARSSRTRSSSAMRSSTSRRQARERRAQSRLDGGRSAGSSASASPIDASGMPAARPAWITATRRRTARVVAPLVALAALGCDQPLGLVEAQRRRRDAAAQRDLSDRQHRRRLGHRPHLHTSSALQLYCLTSSALEIVASAMTSTIVSAAGASSATTTCPGCSSCCAATPSTTRAPPRRSTSTGCSTTASST